MSESRLEALIAEFENIPEADRKGKERVFMKFMEEMVKCLRAQGEEIELLIARPVNCEGCGEPTQ